MVLPVHPEERRCSVRFVPVLYSVAEATEWMLYVSVDEVLLNVARPRDGCGPLSLVTQCGPPEDHADGG